jgi:bisphosphoglycerate-dependent phosphoglycerate mutase
MKSISSLSLLSSVLPVSSVSSVSASSPVSVPHLIRTMVSSLLSLSNSNSSSNVDGSCTGVGANIKPIVKLYSLDAFHNHNNNSNKNKKLRIIHLIRHAEGYHNVNNDYKNPKYIDAKLTPKGIDQSKSLSNLLSKQLLKSKSKSKSKLEQSEFNLYDVECVISSPMRRAVQTAQYSFQHQLFSSIHDDNDNGDDNVDNETKSNVEVDEEVDVNVNVNLATKIETTTKIPFLTCEEWRETVNYVCDQRINTSQLKQEFPFIKYYNDDCNNNEIDPIWKKYELIHGSLNDYTKIRESKDDIGLYNRGRKAWEFIHSITGGSGSGSDIGSDIDSDSDSDDTKSMDESMNANAININDGFNNIAVVSHSAFFMHMFTRPELGIVSYEDEIVKKLMTEKPFENCEMRSIAFEIVNS